MTESDAHARRRSGLSRGSLRKLRQWVATAIGSNALAFSVLVLADLQFEDVSAATAFRRVASIWFETGAGALVAVTVALASYISLFVRGWRADLKVPSSALASLHLISLFAVIMFYSDVLLGKADAERAVVVTLSLIILVGVAGALTEYVILSAEENRTRSDPEVRPSTARQERTTTVPPGTTAGEEE